jgi:hypothetical protein
MLGILIAIVVALLIFWWKAKITLWIVLILLLGAFGVEYFDYDVDLGRLWDTGSVSESRVSHKKWLAIFGSDCIDNDLNCSNFQTQAEAQAKYDMCAQQIARDNNTSQEQVRSVDVYGLDGDKDGTVCEALK